MGWKVKKKPGKLVVFHGAEALVIKFWTEAGLIPRWRIVTGAITFSFVSGALLSTQHLLAGVLTGALALLCGWAIR